MVGSYNFDRWSRRRNLEVSVAAVDTVLGERLHKSFQRSLKRADEVTLDAWEQRLRPKGVLQWACYQLLQL